VVAHESREPRHPAISAIESEEDVAVSAVTALEIVAKQAAGNMDDAEAGLDDPSLHELRTLPVTWAHAKDVRLLPLLHRDPFDRLLIAQARVERRTLVTADAQVRAYDVAKLPA